MNNHQYIAHPGYKDTSLNIQALFSTETLLLISRAVTDALRDLYEPGIIVPLDIICNVLNALYEAYRPPSGDPITMYNIVSNENPNAVDAIINQTINVIVGQVRSQLIMEQNNSKLTKWSTVLGTHNEQGIRSHPVLKLRNRRPQTMMINMPLA
jgi:hypothetical protein